VEWETPGRWSGRPQGGGVGDPREVEWETPGRQSSSVSRSERRDVRPRWRAALCRPPAATPEATQEFPCGPAGLRTSRLDLPCAAVAAAWAGERRPSLQSGGETALQREAGPLSSGRRDLSPAGGGTSLQREAGPLSSGRTHNTEQPEEHISGSGSLLKSPESQQRLALSQAVHLYSLALRGKPSSYQGL